MSAPDYDLIIVGAGIQGAGIAQAAAAAGYRVLLLEQTAVAAATSSRSSKLIHGGLRYLESMQFGLVRKSLRERDILLDIAPHLVELVPFYIPVYKETTRRPWQLRLGLSLYALLGGLERRDRFRVLSRREREVLRGIRQQGLQTVYQYWDAQTDDAALTRAVVVSAEALGAELHCPARFQQAEVDAGQVRLVYGEAGREVQVSARVLINTAGPWVGDVMSRIEPSVPPRAVDLVQGAHLVIDVPAPEGVFYVEAPRDRRAVFVMPWQGKTLIGTTETLFEGDPASVAPTDAERDYLLDVWRHYFPDSGETVIDAFAGLRVLPRSEKSVFNRARDTVFQTSHPGNRVLTLYGGKLTGYRATAEEALGYLQSMLPPATPRADTRTLRLEPVDIP
ncbi:MAG TPA: FAD-dependent oxidoreductase [Gammaproteobacteria bacterium]|nr:FAD-dependent oxidoreductase [Gammaproteobacteria bacterium]